MPEPHNMMPINDDTPQPLASLPPNAMQQAAPMQQAGTMPSPPPSGPIPPWLQNGGASAESPQDNLAAKKPFFGSFQIFLIVLGVMALLAAAFYRYTDGGRDFSKIEKKIMSVFKRGGNTDSPAEKE